MNIRDLFLIRSVVELSSGNFLFELKGRCLGKGDAERRLMSRRTPKFLALGTSFRLELRRQFHTTASRQKDVVQTHAFEAFITKKLSC